MCHYIVWIGQRHRTGWPQNQSSTCLHLLSAEIKGTYHHTWLEISFFRSPGTERNLMSSSGLTACFTLRPRWGLYVKCKSCLFQGTFMGVNWWNVYKTLSLPEYNDCPEMSAFVITQSDVVLALLLFWEILNGFKMGQGQSLPVERKENNILEVQKALYAQNFLTGTKK